MARPGESSLGYIYRRAYEALCGKHPRPRLWHFQYLDTFYLYRRLRVLLPNKAIGVVLDVGCGDGPYKNWSLKAERYIGIDIGPGAAVDHIVDNYSSWPMGDSSVDTVLCTQVLEHVKDLTHLTSEVDRVLRKSGVVIGSFPFLYNEHGAPHDYRRISFYGAQDLWPKYTIECIERQGGAGSTLGILLLNWIDATMNRSFLTRLLKALGLPVWLVVSLLVNVTGLLLDRLDHTDAFYSNVLVVLKKAS